MTMKVLGREATPRLIQLAGDKTPPPAKIIEHKERIEAWTQSLKQKWINNGGVYQDEVDLVVKMKMRLDGMCGDWAEGVERVRWCDLPTKSDLCVDDIIREAVYDTESVYGAHGVGVLAAYLELLGNEGMFKKLVERYLLEIRPLLEEMLPFEGEVAQVLTNPRAFFKTTDDDEIRLLVTERFSDKVNARSPDHVKRAMIAHIEFGLGNYVAALSEAAFAHHEKHVPNFGEELYRPDSVVAQAEMLEVEMRQAEILIELLGR